MPCPRPSWFRWWLIPLTSVVHFSDELFAGSGFYTYVTSIGGTPISMTRFALATLFAFLSITIASWLARKRYDWVLFALAAIIFTNALTHLAESLVTRSYSPGLASGLLIWLPLGSAILYRGFIRKCLRVWFIGLVVGAAMNFVVILFTVNLGRIP